MRPIIGIVGRFYNIEDDFYAFVMPDCCTREWRSAYNVGSYK